jgi:phage tail-like protein
MLTRLPPIPRPPHDPTWLTLDSRQGWQEAELDQVTLSGPEAVLRLAVASGGRALTEPSGSFGGLVPPANVAVDVVGGVYLLDTATATLKRFDRACCRFVPVPCFGGVGPDARQLQSPAGITFVRGNLFVADTGNRRVAVYATRGYVLRGFWAPPAAEQPVAWTPVAVAGDARGRLYVADPANGSVHRFGRGGDWQTRLSGLGAVRHLAVDCHDRLYVVIDAQPAARVFGPDGVEQAEVTDMAALVGRFPPMPFRVDSHGALDFGPPCGVFDPAGAPLPGGAAADVPKYAPIGRYLSQPLDSRIYRCQWHRIRLCGVIPPGTTVTVATHTSEVAQPADIIAALRDDEWQTWQVARDVAGEWDALARSGGGRYLWLRLELRGNRATTPCLSAVTLEFPRISLRRYLPAVFGEDSVGADFTDRFLAVFDTTLRSIERHVDAQAGLFDARSTPATRGPKAGIDFLSWIASWIGLVVDRQWPEWRRRAFVRQAPKLFDVRGTRVGLWGLLLLYLGWPSPRPAAPDPGATPASPRCTPRPLNCDPPPPCRPWDPPPLILEHYQLRRWLFVGGARLGEQAVLWGKRIVNRARLDDGAQVDTSQLIATQDPYRDPFHVYASRFSVFVPACHGASPQARKSLEALLRTESPAHTRWHLQLVEPRFRIGVQSMIGLDAVVGRYPTEGVTVGTSTLGTGTVLGESPDGLGGDGRPHPSMRIGRRSQVGSTTRLD